MTSHTLSQRALALLRKEHKHEDLVLVHAAEVLDPANGETLHEFRAVAAAAPNGPSWRILLAADGSPRDPVPGLDPLILASRPVIAHAGPPITIQPESNVLTLNPGQTFDETITVTVPPSAGTGKADVYFLADTTGSMGSVLAAVQAGANTVLAALNGLGLDLAFGVGNYKDFPPAAPSPFTHQLAPTNVAATVAAAIGSWSATGGGDLPEGQFIALNQLAQAPGGSIGWRAGARRIIVWIGDAPGHDPVCTAVSGGVTTITEASLTAALVAQNIAVLAISTATPGLDADPKAGATDYTGTCGAPGGSAGQGTRLAAATGGKFVTGVNPGTIVNTIIDLVKGSVAGINNVKLVPSASIAPLVVSITPAAGYGPLSGDVQHVLKFEVRFQGIACKDSDQVFTGTLDVVADGVVVAAKKVQVTIPACRPRTVRYSVKFVCGTQGEACGCCTPVRPGQYATHISIHNYSQEPVTISKRFIPVVLAGAPLGREPKIGTSRAEDRIELPPHTATMDDCCRITELLFGAPVDALTIGILEIIATRDVSITAVYTTCSAIDVVQVAGQQV
jgi:hypothetical protein